MYKSEITLNVNGEERSAYVRHADTLLYVLREELGLTGAKPGCLNGDCGACTIDVDGESMKSCLMLAVEAVGKKITTVEGLENLPLQTEFIKKSAFQCGYCTPGFIMNGSSLTKKYPNADDTQIKDCLESNICRCTGYQEIEEAVKSVLSNDATV
ncbi:(2Fe-2S)-binding protein [Geosporobacter ferrireducens]|uniref:(2Fe-2S)-binding protein n=1 Tax=Geosporobacter ferrireducens TaxID=1424294 RepID=A0A1D8GM40_9FIRM|nr:(2Fe-2S)-binding protein [Geosporobacter ferrireducens]AOT71984.1 (2Fe-2S)-binding protein [Geosporobacter ferrireducens]MTI55854.1 (2Fe-2S)-binding protein [Geosporobacter ferrireducens]